MATSRIADSVGRVLGDRYRLTRPLGTGASAHVFVAEDITLRRRVAIKILHPALAGDEAFLRRFRAEAQAVASLRHPNILRVYDWGDDAGSPFLVMELLEGGSLRSMLDRGVLLSPGQGAAMGADVARALDYAHRRGLVHRDIKPANRIFDDEGRVTVADFGLARALAEATWTEPAGAVVGTARYAAPELVRGATLDSRADVYSLALLLVEATTGVVPFATDTTLGTLMARIERPIPVPDEAGPLKAVLESAGQIDPALRLDAGGLARALDDVAARLPHPAPLPLAGPLQSDLLVERDDVSPTEHPGAPRLFDRERADGADPVVTWREPPDADPPHRVPEMAGSPAGPKRHRLRKLLLLVLALLLVAGGGGYAWANLSGRLTPTHPVPNVVGEPQASAAAHLRPLHFGLVVTGHQYSSRYRPEEVISQVPTAGKMREGSRVQVVLSAGPQPIAVPGSLRNYSLEDAQRLLTSLGLTYQVTQNTDMTILADHVISSTPDSGTLLPGQAVQLVVSTGKPQAPVPPLNATNGASFAAAQAALSAAGLGATETDDWSDTINQGQVISFDPPSGTSITVGAVVTVHVSKGPHLVAIPNVHSYSVGAASQALQSAGFVVSGVTGNPLGTVTGTNPAAGTMAHYGAAVQIITG
ncbi:MAG: PASTA domain-containing protein [Acidimicrobiales bacterium]|nr:PASTA domain-containing protein [Acidimicrobiales bacterium]